MNLSKVLKKNWQHFTNTVTTIFGLLKMYNCLFVPNLPQTFLVLTINIHLCVAGYRVRVRVSDLQKFNWNLTPGFLWLIAYEKFYIEDMYNRSQNFFWKPVSFIALKYTCQKTEKSFWFSLVLIFFGQKMFLLTCFK